MGIQKIKRISFLTLVMLEVGIYPALVLYCSNISEVAFKDAYGVMLYFAGVSCAVGVLWCIFMRSIDKGIIMGVISMLIIENYALIQRLTQKIFWFSKYWHIVPLLLLIVIGVSLIIKRRNSEIYSYISLVIGIVFSVLLLMNIIIAVPQINFKSMDKNGKQAGINVVDDITNAPTIYYFLLDEYSSETVLKKYYDYDNSQFYENLETAGFSVARNGHNDSHKSSTIITNYLNLDYVVDDSFSELEKKTYRELPQWFELLLNRGYKIYALGEAKTFLADGAGANVEFLSQSSVSGATTIGGKSFKDLIVDKSMFYPFNMVSMDSLVEDILGPLEQIKRRDAKKGEMYFTYIKCPHEPFIFKADGNRNDVADFYNWKDKGFYRDQLIYITSQIEECIEVILKKDPEAVIVLQSDHSARASSDTELYRKWISVEDMRTFLNAVYIPEKQIDIEGQTGVNTLIMVMNEVFDLEIELRQEIPYNE